MMPQDNVPTTERDAATHDVATQAAAPETAEHTGAPRKSAVTRKRVTNARQSGPQATDQAQSTTRRTFYDYYDRDNDQQRASAAEPDSRDPRARRSPGQPRIIVRRQDDQQGFAVRQDNYDRDNRYGRDSRDDQADRRFPTQPRPAQSFFGFFGDRRYQNDRD